MGVHCHFIHFLFNIFIIRIYIIKTVFYFQNTFPFVLTSRQTDDIGTQKKHTQKKRPKHLMRQTIVYLEFIPAVVEIYMTLYIYYFQGDYELVLNIFGENKKVLGCLEMKFSMKKRHRGWLFKI